MVGGEDVAEELENDCAGPPAFCVDIELVEGSLSVAVGVLPDVTFARFPVGAPIDPNCCATCTIPDAAPGWLC